MKASFSALLLLEEVLVSLTGRFPCQKVASFKVTFSVRGIFLSVFQLHLVEDTICCDTWPAWHLECHLDRKATEPGY